MLKKTAAHTGLCLMALALGACSFLKQPAAPTEAGNSNNTPYTGSQDNPYGQSAPYTPPADNSGYTPAPTYTPPSSGGSYTPSYAPVDINAATHTVVRGDTVYNISKRYNISQDNLRAWNNIVDNNIRTGQVLRVKPAGYVPPASGGSTYTPPPAQTTPPATTTQPTTPPPAQSSSSAGSTRSAGGLVWQRPTQGSVLRAFGGNSKGIDFGGNAGQPVVAAADGKVVYSGSGLRGYGNLIIVQHNQTYLTAYGNNQSLMAKEGQQVKRGQQIATMGSSDASRTQLHFELRENGQPVDPKNYLPM
ncbi:lipoprotein NlpD [Neisseria sp. HSC-16F19]|nr:peptidoglycan DD-metalloendopeptidase family protein [Neisseria sp. HSC-16F19]MCP2039626.1 lipoprotein NlpD [Neisseria sp. HSC-16F19]